MTLLCVLLFQLLTDVCLQRMDQLKWLLLKYDLFFPILFLFKTLSQVSQHYLVQISIAGNVTFDICKMF